MSGEWIKLRNNLWDDPRVVGLANELEEHLLIDPVLQDSWLLRMPFFKCAVLGALSRIWALADQYTLDGALPHYTPAVLNDVLGMTPAFDFAGALIRIDWLRIEDGRLVIPRFSEHNGQSAKARHQNTMRQKKRRASVALLSRSGSGAVATKKKKKNEKKKQRNSSSEEEFQEVPSELSAAPADGAAASEPGEEPRAEPKKGTPNPIWDAVCLAFGLKPVTKSECKRVGRIVADLKVKAAQPEEIALRLERYRRAWPDVAATPEALLKHWDTFALEATSKPATTKPSLDEVSSEWLRQRQKNSPTGPSGTLPSSGSTPPV